MNHRLIFPGLFFFWLLTLGCGSLSMAELAEVQLAQAPAPVFNQCDPHQKAVLERALRGAQDLARNSLQVLNSTPEGSRESSARYREWFGAYDRDNYELVSSHFQHIYDALATQTLTFSCICSDLKLAYVHPDQPYEITLCASFWSAPVAGTDSQAGTIVHEISHFVAVAGTQDVTYSQRLVRMTAEYIPAKAVTNADSYKYFAENNPPLEPLAPDL